MIRFLRREDGGGLVEDQEVGAAVERLEDLHPLALAHAEVRHARVGIDLQVILAAQTRKLGAGPRHPRAEPEATLDPQHHVLQHRERLHQHEVLMHHPDPRRQRVLRRPERHRSPPHEHLAPIRPVIPVQDPHQRRLPRPVLPHDPMNRSPPAPRATHPDWHGPTQTTCRSPATQQPAPSSRSFHSERRLRRRNPALGLGGGSAEHAVRRATSVGRGAKPPSEATSPCSR